ncbi:MAG: peptidoglycan-binding domain-containing protein [Chthoniobacterales bacterium]
MGKFPIALLVTVSQLFVIGWIRADEQVRQIQEELLKRHLFFGNADGVLTPALVTALSRYQNKKGFPVTGLLDSQTCASLGIPDINPRVPPTPFVVVQTGDVRGMNGELLPNSMPLFVWTDAISRVDAQPIDNPSSAAPLAKKPEKDSQSAGKSVKSQARTSGRRAKPHRETNPFVLAYQTVDHALKAMFSDTPANKKRAPRKRG